MDVSSPGIINGTIADEYGSKGTEFADGGMPSRSLPINIEGAPAGTASYAVIFDDPDSVPVCGFKWVHWLAAGIATSKIPENASQTDKKMIQGYNSWYQHGISDKLKASYYGGPAPPDREHKYILTVLALDFVPALRNGFSYDDLMKISKDHVLAKASVSGKYSPKH